MASPVLTAGLAGLGKSWPKKILTQPYAVTVDCAIYMCLFKIKYDDAADDDDDDDDDDDERGTQINAVGRIFLKQQIDADDAVWL